MITSDPCLPTDVSKTLVGSQYTPVSPVNAATDIRSLAICQSHIYGSQFSGLLDTSLWLQLSDQFLECLFIETAGNQHWGISGTRGDSIDSDALFDKLSRGAVHKVAEGALGG